jgi:hypothetical protein
MTTPKIPDDLRLRYADVHAEVAALIRANTDDWPRICTDMIVTISKEVVEAINEADSNTSDLN